MIIIKLKGGLGNQMFQYAVGRSLEKRKDLSVYYDISAYRKGGTAFRDTIRAFSLSHFHTHIREAAPEEIADFNSPIKAFIRKVKNKFSPPNWYSVDQHVLHPHDNTYLEGWWQTDGYFKDYADTIRKDFTLIKPLGVTAQSLFLSIKEFKLPGTAPVSVHIRRGDYVTNTYASAHHGALDLEYYNRALEEISKRERKQLHLYVFSDDIEWAKAHMQSHHTIHFVSCPEIEDYEEIVLMSHCEHHIIANSSFSWWGAWLNPSPSKIVIAPKQWLRNSSVNTKNALPPEWIRI